MVRDQASMPRPGLGFLEALLAEPHGDVQRAGSVVADDDDRFVGIQFGVGAGGDVAHGHQQGVLDAGRVELPLLANVYEDGGVGLAAEGGEGLGRDLRRKHVAQG